MAFAPSPTTTPSVAPSTGLYAPSPLVGPTTFPSAHQRPLTPPATHDAMTAVAALAEQVRAVSEQQARGEAAVHELVSEIKTLRASTPPPAAPALAAPVAMRTPAAAVPAHVRPSPRDATRSPTLATAAAQDEELQHVLRQLRRSRADAVDELAASQQRARKSERGEMAELMAEVRSWKMQNEERLKALTANRRTPPKQPAPFRAAAAALGDAPTQARTPARQAAASPPVAESPLAVLRAAGGGPRAAAAAAAARSNGAAQPSPLRPQSARPGGGARDAGDHRSLRELQKELESLKRSLSVYLGPGLQSRTPLKSN